MRQVRLTQGRITLRPPEMADCPSIVRRCQDPQVVAWTTVPSPYTAQDARDWVALCHRSWQEDRLYAFTMEVDGEPAGALHLERRAPGVAEIGYATDPSVRGQGLTLQACSMLLRWGFEQLELSTIRWAAVRGNWASRRIAWRLGFHHEGSVRGMLSQRGLPRDGWLGSLLRSEPMRPRTRWLDVPTIDLGRCLLRANTDADAERITQAYQDQEVMAWLPSVPEPFGAQQARSYLEADREDRAAGTALRWAAAGPDDDRLIGQIVLSLSAEQAELGYWSHPAGRRRGLISLAARGAVRHALIDTEDGGLGAHRVLARVAEPNTRSAAVALAAGLRLSGRDRDAERLRDGSRVDHLRFEAVVADLPQAP